LFELFFSFFAFSSIMRRLLNLNVRELKMEDGRWRSPESYAYSAYAGMH